MRLERPRRLDHAPASPATAQPGDAIGGTVSESSMDEVLRLAEQSLLHIRQTLDDYTATMVKQETIGGVLTGPVEMAMKVQCSHRGGKLDDSEPMRVYLRFIRPPEVAGREVIWAEDLHDGKLVVREAGMLGLLPLRLEPAGMIAMRGERYPIYEIGLTKLVQKLIERGRRDRDNPDVTVWITEGLKCDGHDCELIEVRRKHPAGTDEDFSRAEIVFDTQRLLPLRYTAYGWSEDPSAAPLIESYTYTDINTNVGLSETDFDPTNPSYQFP